MKEGFGTIQGAAPTGWLRLFLRLPILLYRARLGGLLGRRFLLLTHTGRVSGALRRTVLEVVRHDPASGVCVVASGWGEKAQWLRNVAANPDVMVTLGGRARPAQARRMTREEAEGELGDYARRHPLALRKLARVMLGRRAKGPAEDVRALAAQVPMVELRPR